MHPVLAQIRPFTIGTHDVFTLGTTGLIAWVLSPPFFVLLVSVVAIGLYARSITLGVSWSKCLLRKPTLIIGFWAAVAVADAAWLIWLR